ncbi:MAG: VIT1/CCC1 family protein [Desulfurococcales archaeon]|nr:VIT1/CCC1 family protein [Desulfurococcales archaeon]
MSAAMGLPPEAVEKAREFCRDERFDSELYRSLALMERDPARRRILEELARQEEEHARFWERLAGGCGDRAGGARIALAKLARRVFGLTFTVKLLERGEEETIRAYRDYLKYLEGGLRDELERIIAEEEEHERRLIGEIDESIIKYMSFIVLGLADAIVEITGVHAGALGSLANTLAAGVTGLIVGFSAAISMGSAAYLQAKQELKRDPVRSAIVTALAYILTVGLLALPYFVTHNMIAAFSSSVILALALVAGFTYYSSVVFDRPFWREVLETTLLTLGTALGAYLFGDFLGRVTGLRGALNLA